MTNDDRLTRIRTGGAIGPADAEWMLGEITQLRGNLSLAEEGNRILHSEIAKIDARADSLETELANATQEIERLRSKIDAMVESTHAGDGVVYMDYEAWHALWREPRASHEPGAGGALDLNRLVRDMAMHADKPWPNELCDRIELALHSMRRSVANCPVCLLPVSEHDPRCRALKSADGPISHVADCQCKNPWTGAFYEIGKCPLHGSKSGDGQL